MAAENFKIALAMLLRTEGGFSDHPKDPGGPTMKGVTQRVYDAFRKRRGKSSQTVRFITDEEVATIYKAQYWDPVKGDDLPSGIDYVLFDGAVNSGAKQSVKWLQRSLKLDRVDGTVGERTLAATESAGSLAALIDAILELRLAFMKALKTWSTFKKGWSQRLKDVEAFGVKLASNAAAAVVPLGLVTSPSCGKALIEDAKTAPVRAVADAATGGGVLGGGTAAALDQLRDQLAVYSDVHWVGQIAVGVACASAVLAIGGLAYGWYARRRKAQLMQALDPDVGAAAA